MKNKKQPITKLISEQEFEKIYLTTPIFSEFKPDESYDRIFDRHGFMMGRMISGSKSLYRQRYPDNEVYFNANIVIESAGKIWYGDIDLTLDTPKLKEVANILGEPLYVLYEMDARFENENKPIQFYKDHARAIISPEKK
jgi:hypothetical protein